MTFTVTMAGLTSELSRAYEIGQRTNDADAMIKAVMAKAKLHGLVIDKMQILTNGASYMSEEDIEAELAKRHAHRRSNLTLIDGGLAGGDNMEGA